MGVAVSNTAQSRQGREGVCTDQLAGFGFPCTPRAPQACCPPSWLVCAVDKHGLYWKDVPLELLRKDLCVRVCGPQEQLHTLAEDHALAESNLSPMMLSSWMTPDLPPHVAPLATVCKMSEIFYLVCLLFVPQFIQSSKPIILHNIW